MDLRLGRFKHFHTRSNVAELHLSSFSVLFKPMLLKNWNFLLRVIMSSCLATKENLFGTITAVMLELNNIRSINRSRFKPLLPYCTVPVSHRINYTLSSLAPFTLSVSICP